MTVEIISLVVCVALLGSLIYIVSIDYQDFMGYLKYLFKKYPDVWTEEEKTKAIKLMHRLFYKDGFTIEKKLMSFSLAYRYSDSLESNDVWK